MSYEKKAATAFSTPSTPHSTRKGRAVEQWEKELFKAFDGQIKRKLVLEDQAFTSLDPRNSTSGLKSNQKLTLRTVQQVTNNENIILKKFDPNFMSPHEIRCRSPGCKQTKKRYPSSPAEPTKEDLYLCPRHKKILEGYMTKMCAEKGIDVSTKYSARDFEGYTSMIGLLESAYLLFVKRPRGSENVLKGKPDIIKEVFINLRNFLMITNALLNPDLTNLLTVLPRVMEIFKEILKILSTDGEIIVQRVTELVALMRSVMQDILFAFGIVYSWIYLAVAGNPGAQIGAGIGGFIGMAGLFAVSPAVGLIAMAGGSLFGGLTGSGIYNLQKERRQQQEADEGFRRYQEFAQMQRNQEVQNEVVVENNQQGMAEPDGGDVLFHITGSESGDLCLMIIFAVGLCFGI